MVRQEGVMVMVKELVLVRHGRAEEDARKGDFFLELSPQGESDLDCIVSGLRHTLKRRQKVHIWSSPVVRSAQTAMKLSDDLKLSNVSFFEFMRDGNFDRFKTQLALLKKTDVLILVGHEPYLGEWSHRLSGRHLAFAKGAAAVFKVGSVSPPEAKLKWFMQPQTAKRTMAM